MQKSNEVKEWFPHNLIWEDAQHAILILNQPISNENLAYLKSIWNSAAFRVAVDGGANQIKDISNNQTELLPDLICGDFDSVSPEVLDFYRKKGIEIIHTPDQDETDFTKAVRLIADKIQKTSLQVSAIIALSRNGDRLDHIFGNLNTLYLCREIISIPIIILGEGSLTWLLWPGKHIVYLTEKMMDSHVGLIPLGTECTNISTSGLKWNLNNDKMNFGGLISTCNLFEKDVVTVSTDTPLIWTMEIKMQ